MAEHYRDLTDDELRELAADFADLTEAAQQALRGEMQSRGLGDPIRASNASAPSNAPFPSPTAHLTNAVSDDPTVNPLIAFGRAPELVPDTPSANGDDAGPHDYTWKTVLCECDTDEEARQLSEALQQAGIDCWIDGGRRSNAYIGYASEGLAANLRILVAADQLDQARAIAARPIPPEIVAESQEDVADFVAPSCPSCGAPDPVLETVEPANCWKCEQCGREWTDSVPAESKSEASSPERPV